MFVLIAGLSPKNKSEAKGESQKGSAFRRFFGFGKTTKTADFEASKVSSEKLEKEGTKTIAKGRKSFARIDE